MPINLKYGKNNSENENYPPKLAWMMGEAKLFVMMIFKSWIFKVHFQLPVKFSSSFSSNFTVCHAAPNCGKILHLREIQGQHAP
jgi:hypothetical protein